MPTTDLRPLLESLYAAAVAAVEPGAAVARALAAEPLVGGRVHVIALGKAARPMARAALDAIGAPGPGASTRLAGGLIVAPEASSSPGANPGSLAVLAGEHPVPGPASCHAAEALARALERILPGDGVLVLLSGGTSSLVAAPLEGIPTADYLALWRLLLASGLPIGPMNAIRKRVSRWAAGRLAVAAAARGAAVLRVLVVSDVIGDDLAAIASGPCVPDSSTAADVRELLEAAGLWPAVPLSVRALLEQTIRDPRLETPKPEHPAFTRVRHAIVANNRMALAGAAAAALRAGWEAELAPTPLCGEARHVGTALARELLMAPPRRCLLWGGETTVTLGAAAAPPGGRCQELALAAAAILADTPAASAGGIALLAAGTDGRDGPTDAAGAVVDARTWDRVARAGRDPARDLAAHASHAALDAAGALLRPGLTGTNVMDVMAGTRG